MTDHVKVYGVKPRIQYRADGILTEYEFPFVIFKTSDINVYFGDVLQDTSTFTVSEARHSDGGSVTFETAPTSGTIITIVRNLPIERTSDFQEGSTLRAKVLNDELDYQIACQQQIAENLNRSMVLPPFAMDSNVDLTLPIPSAGKAIVWNSEGTNLENSTIELNALESTLKDYKNQAQSAASSANNKANIATMQAQTATTQAGIAIEKATETALALNQLNSLRSNCITEIPQDVKLELNNGALTIKSGSSFYYPNGEDVFTKVTTSSDISVSMGTASGERTLLVTVNSAGTSFSILGAQDGLNLFSGDSVPTVTVPNAYWYDTGNNIIKRTQDTGASWAPITGAYICLPMCSATFSSGNCIKINHIFNGFGYIGNTFFILPKTKILIANGRNNDGTLKSVEYVVNSVKTASVGTNREDSYMCLAANGLLSISSTLSSGNSYYDEEKNLFFLNQNDQGGFYTPVGVFSVQNDMISFKPCTVFHSIDYNMLAKHNTLRTVIQSKISGNSWYRIWSDGWIEQGGIEQAEAYTATGTITYLYPFSDTKYTIVTSDNRIASTNSQGHFNLNNKQTTGINWNLIATASDFVNTMNWYACGK